MVYAAAAFKKHALRSIVILVPYMCAQAADMQLRLRTKNMTDTQSEAKPRAAGGCNDEALAAN